MMKKIQEFLFCISSFYFSLYSNNSIEVGRYDGGEYCQRTKDSNLGRMYPDDQSAKSGSDIPCACEIEEDEAIPENSWDHRVMDFEAVRSMFPILKQVIHDHPLIYFDSAATAQMPQIVVDAMIDYYQNYKSNVGRGLYDFAEQATQMFEKTRLKIARFIGAKKQEIVFTSGATAGINVIAHIWAEHHVQAGDEILVSEVEHNANFIPWQQLVARKGATLNILPLAQDGTVDVQTLKTYLSEKTKLVAITQQSNILGIINDVSAIVQAAHAVGAKVLIDAAQSIAHQKIDVEKIQCDFLVFSGHKLFGPTGVGVLFIKQDLFRESVLQNFGGGMVLFVTPLHSEFKPFPYCLEPGTQAIAEVIGLGAAIDFVQNNINFEQAQNHETDLVRKLCHELQKMPQISLMSPVPCEKQHSNLVTFTVKDMHAYDVASYLNEHGIAVRSGFHCVQPYHDAHGGNASVRVSLSVYNTQAEIDFFVDCLKRLLNKK